MHWAHLMHLMHALVHLTHVDALPIDKERGAKKCKRCSHEHCSQGGCGRQVQQGRVCFNQGQCETPTLQPRQAWQASLTMWSMHQARDDSETPMLQPSRCAVHKTDATADAAESEKFIECFWTRVESNTKTQI